METNIGLFPCQKNVPHLIPEGWEVTRDVEPTVLTREEIFSLPEMDEAVYISMVGKVVLKLSVKGLSDVPTLLGPDGKGLETIPAEFRDGRVCITLTGTELENPLYRSCTPYLFWSGDQWKLGFYYIDDDDHGTLYFVHCK